ncbi:hypothetical protein SAMN06295967_11575 [Belliella buryatensis]|uniref:DNA polymerase-3 subunit gamma/tau n=1 Tax=Belliella buryatensis TaxID=1500549 RepID=A0A239GBW8_9BACT|nr:DNA polymerase III subunit gamma/tau [Belliella buryatensis]SNS66288.1 hypothetical protein SAMN06295967_11575 [Belliella buryatensis]
MEIKQTLEETQVQEAVNQLTETFDEAKLKSILEGMVEEFKSNHKNLEVTVFKQPFRLDGEQITFLLNGEIQEEIFGKIRGEVQQLLRRKLNNYSVSLLSEIHEEAVPEGQRLYTSTDKLNYLLEKHAPLRELQRKFGLETDF